MQNLEFPSKLSQEDRWRAAADSLKLILEQAGWKLKAVSRAGSPEGDFRVRRGKAEYAVELKAASEGRSDRLVPLFAQAALQLGHRDRGKAKPLAVLSAPRIARRAAEQVLEFAHRYAPDVAVGLFDFEGLRLFRGPGLEDLDADAGILPRVGRSGPIRESRQLFSDLNQWMLKVLLAPELPEHLLSAPRGRYKNASVLAQAAQVAVMSAFRFVELLRAAGYLHESASSLSLVRREDLFARWQAANDRPVKEAPMRFRLGGNPQAQLRKVLDGGRACLALFAAADALKLGFVHGVPPYVYVERVQPSSLEKRKNLRPCEPGEPPDLVLRQAPAPQSVFRGMVQPAAASDVVQIWLDVASYPARGREQADLIRRRVLDKVINNEA